MPQDRCWKSQWLRHIIIVCAISSLIKPTDQNNTKDLTSKYQVPFLILMCKDSVSVAQLPLIDNGKTSVVYHVDLLPKASLNGSLWSAAESRSSGSEANQMSVVASLGKSEWQQIAAAGMRGQEVEQQNAGRQTEQEERIGTDADQTTTSSSKRPRRKRESAGDDSSEANKARDHANEANVTSARSDPASATLGSGSTQARAPVGASTVGQLLAQTRAQAEEEDGETGELSDLDVHMRMAYVFVANMKGRIHRFELDRAGQHPAELRAQAARMSAAPTSGVERNQQKARLIWSRGKSQQLTASRAGATESPTEEPTAEEQLHDAPVQGDPQPSTISERSPPDWQRPRTRLALDWLNELLFVLDQNRLIAVGLDGRNEVTLIDDFTPNSRPLDIKVDPVNNFLFWLQRGKFHNAIYKLDLNALSMPSAAERLLANAQRLNQRNRSQPDSSDGGASDDEPMALISHHYAHPIIAHLPKQSTLFTIDHKHSRIYVPFIPQGVLRETLETTRNPGDDAEIFASPDQTNSITHMNASLEQNSVVEGEERNCSNRPDVAYHEGLILAFNLDGTDVGPLRGPMEKAHLAGLGEMRDLTLDHKRGFLYWLTAGGSEIFEEYKVEKDDKFYSAVHSLDLGGYSRLIHFDLANQPNTSRSRLDLHQLMRTLTRSSTANRWTRADQDFQEDPNWPSRLNVRQRTESDEVLVSRSPFMILALGFMAVLCCFLVYMFVFQTRSTSRNPGIQHHPESIGGSSLNGPNGTLSNINTGWLSPTKRCNTLPITSSTGIDSATSYDFDSAHYDVGNAIDEHYRDMVDDHGYLNANFNPLVKLSCWPTNLDYLSNKLYIPSEFQQDEALSSINRISIDQLIIDRRSPLGEGYFGMVMQGTIVSSLDAHLEPARTTVAIKKLKDNATKEEKRDFLQEAKLLADFKHPNIVQLIGICLDRGSTLIIMELMLGGDLTRYMRECVNNSEETERLTSDDLLAICIDIASGCCYLEERNFIHRDIAARNCLVSSRRREERVVKLADFGLARDIYKNSYYKKLNDSVMPLKWMAPECLIEQKFTTMSDVWSFGILMWEVMSYCMVKPYASIQSEFIRAYLEGGKRLAKPKDCSDEVYRLMNRCWELDPNERPTFEECKSILVDMRNDPILKNVCQESEII